jgi:hypothetical protein
VGVSLLVVCAPKTQKEKIWENDGMDNADAVLQELETHVQRIIEHYDPKNPYGKVLNVTDKRGSLAVALKHLIDQRVQDAIKKYDADLARNL